MIKKRIIKRRDAICEMIVFAGAITFLPSCVGEPDKASIALKSVKISAGQEALLASIASTIIPKTDTPGASEVGSHLFVLRMLDDCYEKDVQQKFIAGLNHFEQLAKERLEHPFVNCSREEREKMLLSVEGKEAYPVEVFDFYEVMKKRTIQGYMTSKYVVVNIKKYTLIPTVPYDGYYRIDNKSV